MARTRIEYDGFVWTNLEFVAEAAVRVSEMQLVIPKGQGHNMWQGFFQDQQLVDFVIRNTRG